MMDTAHLNGVESDEDRSSGVQSFLQKQRQVLGSYIEDQLGPAAQLDQIISGNPPLSGEKISEPQLKSPEDQN
jgi:hypothetical protein